MTEIQRRWVARILMGVPVLFLLFDASIKLVKIQAVTDGMAALGYPDHLARILGVVLLLLVVLYLMPRTAVLGALLLTGYLGGAVATHVRVENPLLSHTLFPVYVALFLWGGLWLRSERLRKLIPLTMQEMPCGS